MIKSDGAFGLAETGLRQAQERKCADMADKRGYIWGKSMISLLVLAVFLMLLLSYRYNLPELFPMNYQQKEKGKFATQSSLIDSYQTLWNTANDLKNFWLYFRSTINKTQYRNQLKTIDDGHVSMDARLSEVMQTSSEARKHLLNNMARFVRHEIEKQQNPPDCSQTDQHVVQISTITCGFGCSLHSVVNGLLQAFVKNRTFVLVSENWRYAEEGWEYAFLPLTKCIRRLRSSGHNGRTDWRLSKLLQWSIPPELRPTLEKLHGQPYAWWIAQFTAYVFRLQPFLEKQLKQLAQEIGFTDSAVGIQIRWGDKLHNEANKHEVEEYMLYVEKWFKQLETREQSVERVIYLATEVKVAWGQLREKYPKYKFIRNLQSPERKGNKFRYRHEGLEDVITDIYFLSRCSYVVCTLSSSVCRTAYELMMNFHDDASTRFQSVDALYRVKGTKQQPWVAVMNHDPAWQDELEMKLGDKITVSLDPHLPFNDGYLRGENLRTGKEGRFPTYKVREELLSYHTFSFQKPWNPEKK